MGIRALGLAVNGFGKGDGHIAEALRMPGGGGIALLDGFDGGVDEAVEEIFDVAIELGVFESDGGLRGERQSQADGTFGKRVDVFTDGSRVGEAGLWVFLAIDELEDAEDFAATVLHGESDQRAGAITGLLVE